ncbi:MerR family transcriptional regulator [Phycicoccus sp. BSK3Z-2]|uniref:MerR family transcriptional regulator n=1 Tax=Phycicoccus avicenniae TaxID=2828860 RepID=A0A941D5C4_9MICO|nr:MerR family transcriptional regulator [Phycicoccus avicenniae]MBR7741853.1 MerR family transcriptional regulator [Phycicoccus avicenniae]
MAWSPRELGELAETSRRTVRHYHDIGLLPAPSRGTNGYGQYGVSHLIRLLRIRRLVGLGLSLPEVAAIGDADEHPASALRALDDRLASAVRELEQTRLELAAMLERASPTDLPAQAAAVASGLPPAERAFLVVLSRAMEPDGLDAYLELLVLYRTHPAVAAFDALPDEPDEHVNRAIGSGIADHLCTIALQRSDLFDRIDAGAALRQRTVQLAIADLYSSNQRDVLVRAARAMGRPTRSFED